MTLLCHQFFCFEQVVKLRKIDSQSIVKFAKVEHKVVVLVVEQD